MDITGYSYLVFFTFVLFAHRLLAGRAGVQKLFLTAASYYFYMTIDWRFAGLLVSLTLINYVAGQIISQRQGRFERRLALALALILSLAILFYFKYFNFFADMANALCVWLGATSLVPYVDVLLPIGISFITLQAITYPMDLYLGRLERPCSTVDFALFIAFFPQLLSGPIVRASYFLPQLQEIPTHVDNTQRFEGLTLIMRGLAKKVIIADTLGVMLVDPAFADPGRFSAAFLWLAMFGYSFQVYLDLSGYTDMALGAARMLGFRLPRNFNRPYMATSISNFWQRWHITMSSFFRDYFYNSLTAIWSAPAFVNLVIVFVAIGLWHGAGWNFIAYGLIHGTLVALEHVNSKRRTRAGMTTVYRGSALVLRIAIVFTVVAMARILFRNTELLTAAEYVSAMFSFGDGAFPLSVGAGLGLLAATSLHFSPVAWRDRAMKFLSSRSPILIGVLFAICIFVTIAFSRATGRGFIYFQF